MTFTLSESDLEDYLFDHPEALETYSLQKIKWIARQFRVPSGIIDLLGYIKHSETTVSPVVVELKSVPLSASALTQVCRYAHDIYNVMVMLDDAYAEFEEQFCIYRAVVTPGTDVPIGLIYEACALNVNVYTFSPKFNLHINGPWGFTDKKRKADDEFIKTIAKNEMFSIFRKDDDNERLKPFEDFLDQKQDGE